LLLESLRLIAIRRFASSSKPSSIDELRDLDLLTREDLLDELEVRLKIDLERSDLPAGLIVTDDSEATDAI
jgi:hypothetical protein